MMNIRDIFIIFTCSGVLMVIIGFCRGQTVTVTGPSAVERGRDTRFVCTGGTSPYVFIWTDISVTPNIIIFTAGVVTYDAGDTKYLNFRISEDLAAGTSTMTIENTQIEDEGQYSCREGQESDGSALTVEVPYTLELSVASPLVDGMMYEATCDALNGRPDLPITWMLGDSGSPCNPVETPPVEDQGLFNKSSECTFQADSANNGETLKCIISGHQVAGLDRENTTTLVIHSAPRTDIITVDFEVQDCNLRVSCVIAPADQPTPSITNYYIISNGTMIHQPDAGNNFVDVELPDFVTDFLCVAGNYLGNTTSQATYGPSKSSPTSYTCGCLSSGASAGIAILAILLAGSIIINVIQFMVWRRHATRSDKNGSQKVTSSDVRGGSNEASDNRAYEMIQSGDRAYTALKISSSGTSRSATIDPENVTFFTRLGSIGRGDFGAVWKGELRSIQGVAAVAIRQIPDHVSKSTNVLQTVKVLCGLPDQANIVKCIGFCQEQSNTNICCYMGA